MSSIGLVILGGVGAAMSLGSGLYIYFSKKPAERTAVKINVGTGASETTVYLTAEEVSWLKEHTSAGAR